MKPRWMALMGSNVQSQFFETRSVLVAGAIVNSVMAISWRVRKGASWSAFASFSVYRPVVLLPPSLPPRPSCCCRLRSHAGALGLVVVRALRAGLGWLPLPALRRRRAPPRGRRPATRALSLFSSLSMRAWPTGCAWRCAPPRAPSSPRPPLPSPSPRMSSRPARCRTSRWPRSPRPRCACSGQSRRSWAAPAFGTTWCDARGWRRWP